MLVCLPLAAPIDLAPLHLLTLCESERVLVVFTEPLEDLSCLTTRGSAVPEMLLPMLHPDAHSESMLGWPAPALTCARWGVHLQDNFPDRGFNNHNDSFPFVLSSASFCALPHFQRPWSALPCYLPLCSPFPLPNFL